MAPMKAMKAMKGKAMKGTTMTATAVYQSVAETTGLKTKEVKGAVEAIMGVASEELKKTGSFKLAGMLNMKLKKKPARPAKKGVNPFTKEPCVFKAKPASKTVRVLAMKKLKEAIN
jgi:nucleoid DNA-binding protein